MKLKRKIIKVEETPKPKKLILKKPKKLVLPKKKLVVKLKRKIPLPPVKYCACPTVPPGVLPAPLMCTWIGEMYACCRKCRRKISYTNWKNGWYRPIEKELQNGTYDPKNYE